MGLLTLCRWLFFSLIFHCHVTFTSQHKPPAPWKDGICHQGLPFWCYNCNQVASKDPHRLIYDDGENCQTCINQRTVKQRNMLPGQVVRSPPLEFIPTDAAWSKRLDWKPVKCESCRAASSCPTFTLKAALCPAMTTSVCQAFATCNILGDEVTTGQASVDRYTIINASKVSLDQGKAKKVLRP